MRIFKFLIKLFAAILLPGMFILAACLSSGGMQAFFGFASIIIGLLSSISLMDIIDEF